MILTARQTLKVTTGDEYRRYLLRFAERALMAAGRAPDEVAREYSGTPPVAALVSHGTWKAACPSEGCGGAIDLLDGWGFWCPYCLCEDGQLRRVAWPEEREAIEALLDVRPVPASRNWLPGESVEALRAENAVRGIEVPR